MSDYLGNLAARSLAPAPALQPRLASRFEPPAIRESPGLIEEAMTEIAPPSAPIPSKIHSDSPSPSGRGGQGVRARRTERSEEHPAHTTVEKVFKPAPEVAERSVQRSEPSPPSSLSQREKGNLIVPAEANRDHFQPLVVMPPPHQNPLPSFPLSHRERGPGGEGSRAEIPRFRPELKPALAPIQPRVAAERPAFAPQRETPAPEPIIHVTIGRIEVRATAAPKAPARERPAARPAVDLDEYLRQRSKGEGR